MAFAKLWESEVSFPEIIQTDQNYDVLGSPSTIFAISSRDLLDPEVRKGE
jgi:hypothetical protein